MFELIVESGDFNLMLVLKSAHFISIESLYLSFFRFKSLKLSRKLLIARLKLFLELVEAFRHAVLLKVGIQVAGELIETSDSSCETFWGHTKLILQRLLSSDQILLLSKQFSSLWILVSNFDPLGDFFLCIS